MSNRIPALLVRAKTIRQKMAALQQQTKEAQVQEEAVQRAYGAAGHELTRLRENMQELKAEMCKLPDTAAEEEL